MHPVISVLALGAHALWLRPWHGVLIHLQFKPHLYGVGGGEGELTGNCLPHPLLYTHQQHRMVNGSVESFLASAQPQPDSWPFWIVCPWGGVFFLKPTILL